MILASHDPKELQKACPRWWNPLGAENHSKGTSSDLGATLTEVQGPAVPYGITLSKWLKS